MDDKDFKQVILGYWRKHGRHDLPWRHTEDPYHILVSEIMLQQTQVDRVIPFYEKFLAAFPTFRVLAKAPVAKLLQAWQGLGYNRRAMMLQRCAQAVVADHAGVLPSTHEALVALPGIGPYTAGAVMAFAFNTPHPVIETNIRRVYLHHYFPGKTGIADEKLAPIIERTLDQKNPRRWYSALMDYGTFLKETIPNPNRRSKQYTKQAKFEGSRRQLRGEILRHALAGGRLAPAALAKKFKRPTLQVREVLSQLSREGLIAV